MRDTGNAGQAVTFYLELLGQQAVRTQQLSSRIGARSGADDQRQPEGVESIKRPPWR